MKDARHRLLSGVRVSDLVLEELRAAQHKGRPPEALWLHLAEQWATSALQAIVVAYYERKRRRAGYR
jgi:hypothetical protein